MDDLRPRVWTSHSKCHGNNISYIQAVRRLADVAIRQKVSSKCWQTTTHFEQCTETSWAPKNNEHVGDCFSREVSILTASHEICSHDVLSPCSTPATDTSAMDGFAVESALTMSASTEYPVKFRIAGIVAAGADIHDSESLGIDGKSVAASDHPCVEIMTGASFPEPQFPQLDAVVKVEDVELVEDLTADKDSIIRYILVSTPVKRFQHRRPAGTDFRTGDLIIAKGTKIEPNHIMALASVGISHIAVATDSGSRIETDGSEGDNGFRVGILPTGSELLNLFDLKSENLKANQGRKKFPDSNGPYVTSATKLMSPLCKVDYLGPCPDDERSLVEALSEAVRNQRYDILVTSGGVSMGRFDLVRKVLETRLDAEIIFHGCLIRPGAPVLFGVIDRQSTSPCQERGRPMTLIGAPGNPIAAAMTVRFFLKPFLKMLQAPQGLSIEELVQMVLSESSSVQISISSPEKARRTPIKAVAFLLAKRQEPEDTDSKAIQTADLLEDQASYKIKPFLQADCWVTVPAGKDKILDGDHTQVHTLW